MKRLSKKFKRIAALVLAVVLVAGIIPLTSLVAFGDGGDPAPSVTTLSVSLTCESIERVDETTKVSLLDSSDGWIQSLPTLYKDNGIELGKDSYYFYLQDFDDDDDDDNDNDNNKCLYYVNDKGVAQSVGLHQVWVHYEGIGWSPVGKDNALLYYLPKDASAYYEGTKTVYKYSATVKNGEEELTVDDCKIYLDESVAAYNGGDLDGLASKAKVYFIYDGLYFNASFNAGEGKLGVGTHTSDAGLSEVFKKDGQVDLYSNAEAVAVIYTSYDSDMAAGLCTIVYEVNDETSKNFIEINENGKVKSKLLTYEPTSPVKVDAYLYGKGGVNIYAKNEFSLTLKAPTLSEFSVATIGGKAVPTEGILATNVKQPEIGFTFVGKGITAAVLKDKIKYYEGENLKDYVTDISISLEEETSTWMGTFTFSSELYEGKENQIYAIIGSEQEKACTFETDYTAPAVSVTKQVGGVKEEGENKTYYKEDVKFSVNVKAEDIDIDESYVDVNGTRNTLTKSGDNSSYEMTLSDDGDCLQDGTLLIHAVDKAGNVTDTLTSGKDFIFDNASKSLKYSGGDIEIDKVNPVVKVTKSSQPTGEDTDKVYNKEDVTYTFEITEKNLDAANSSIKYKTVDGTVTPLTLVQDGEDKTRWTAEFTLTDSEKAADKDGDELEKKEAFAGIEMVIVDKAGNYGDLDETGNVAFDKEENTFVYDEKPIKIDEAAPVATITKSPETAPAAVGGVEYYNSDVTYTIKVTDVNLDTDNTQVKYTIKRTEDNTEKATETTIKGIKSEDNPNGWTKEGSTYTATIVVSDDGIQPDEIGAVLTDISVKFVDKAGNETTSLVSSKGELKQNYFLADDTKYAGLTFEYKDGKFGYTGNDICVDETRSNASVTLTTEAAKKTAGEAGTETDYYNKSVTYTVTVTESHFDAASTITYTLDGKVPVTITGLNSVENPNGWVRSGNNLWSAEFTIDDANTDPAKAGDLLTGLDLVIKDLANNYSEVGNVVKVDDCPFEQDDDYSTNHKLVYSGHKVKIDKVVPKVVVTKDVESAPADEGIEYYNKAVTYTVKVTDNNFDPASYVEYLLDAAEGPEKLTGLKTEDNPTGWKAVEDEDCTYEVSFVIDDKNTDPAKAGDLLEKIAVSAFDYAGSYAQEVSEEEGKYNVKFGAAKANVLIYGDEETELKAKIDKIKPGVVIETFDALGTSYANKRGTNRYYFNDEESILMKATVTELNFDAETSYITYTTSEDGKAAVDTTVYFSDFAKANTVNVITKEGVTLKLTTDGASQKHIVTVQLEDGYELTGLFVHAQDFADWYTDLTQSVDYIMDTVGADVKVELLNNDKAVESVFTKNGYVYVKLADKVQGNSGEEQTGSQTVTLQVTVKDSNIAHLKDAYEKSNLIATAGIDTTSADWNVSGIKDNNPESTIIYTDTVTVAADKTGFITFDLKLQDVAGNNADSITFVKGSADKDDSGYAGVTVYEGKSEIAGTVNVDRRRTTNDPDNDNTPTITLTKNTTPVDTVDGKPLYDRSASYQLVVTDGNGHDRSGLKSVEWTVESDQAEGVITTTDGKTEFSKVYGDSEYVCGATFTIPVIIAADHETNDITITVTIEDNAGNKIVKKERLAIDVQKPRVTVSYDNNSVQNEKYFKADRTLTVTIEDLNFDTTKTTLTTEVGKSTWANVGGYKWQSTMVYDADGDYTFAMATADKAKNEGTVDYTNGNVNAAPESFTVDKTNPVIAVTFDNNDVKNGKYYKAARTATVAITEHNFRASDVSNVVTASLDGSTFAAPASSGYGDNGDLHSATTSFTTDGDYTMKVNYTDLAGNAATEVSIAEFTVDLTKPEITISGVKNETAYPDNIQPNFEFYDINFDDEGYDITWTVSKLTKADTLKWEDNSITTTILHGENVAFNDLEHVAGNDGIYVLSAEITDLAGNEYESEEITYSVNRFGSVYTVEDSATAALMESGFTRELIDLEIIETNPDKLKNQEITLSVNGTTVTLAKDTDFTIKETSSGGWYQYIYTIKASAFDKQGAYTITLTSEDEAGNKNSNRTSNEETYNVDLDFVYDSEAPAGWIDVTGLKSGSDSIQAQSTEVSVNWEDNNGVAKVLISVKNDDASKAQEITVPEEDLAYGSYSFTVEESDKQYVIEATLVDYAGNETALDSVTFFLNGSWLQQYWHNKALFFGTIGGFVVVAGLVIFLVTKKKKVK